MKPGTRLDTIGLQANGQTNGDLWAAFVAPGEVERRIEQIRAAEAPLICPACGSTANPMATRRCYRCNVPKLLAHFPRHRRLPLGRHYICSECNAKDGKRRRIQRILKVAS